MNILVYPCKSEIGFEIHTSCRGIYNVSRMGASSIPGHGEFAYLSHNVRVLLNLIQCVHNEDKVWVFNTTSCKERRRDGLAFSKGVFRSTCSIPADLLNDGVYRVSVLFVEDTSVVISGQNDLLEFEVHDGHSERGKWYGKWPGVTCPRLQWDTTHLEGVS